MLVAGDGSIAGRAVSKEDGSFSVNAPRDGNYSIRVLRIGFRPTTAGPVELHAATPMRRDVPLSGRVWVLPSVQVTDRGQCQVHPDTSAIAFRLWDEARIALLATVLTESEPLGVRLTHDERTFDASGGKVLVDSSSTTDGSSRKPIVTLVPDSLAQSGYTTNDDHGGTTYWGECLLESFAWGHCIRPGLRPAPAATAGVLGVGFDPPTQNAHVDVRGVLWIDRRSGLRSGGLWRAWSCRKAATGTWRLCAPRRNWTVDAGGSARRSSDQLASHSTVPGAPPGRRTNQRWSVHGRVRHPRAAARGAILGRGRVSGRPVTDSQAPPCARWSP
jgi:hypothetical protein